VPGRGEGRRGEGKHEVDYGGCGGGGGLARKRK